MRKIKVTIHKDGTQHVEALNGEGEHCLELTEARESRFGEAEDERVYKPEIPAPHS